MGVPLHTQYNINNNRRRKKEDDYVVIDPVTMKQIVSPLRLLDDK